MTINGILSSMSGGSLGVIVASIFHGIHWETIIEVVVYAVIGAVIGYFTHRILDYIFRKRKSKNRKKHKTNYYE